MEYLERKGRKLIRSSVKCANLNFHINFPEELNIEKALSYSDNIFLKSKRDDLQKIYTLLVQNIIISNAASRNEPGKNNNKYSSLVTKN